MDANYVCQHGTAHTQKEANEAIAWAAEKYPRKTLEEIGEKCWIEAWRKSK